MDQESLWLLIPTISTKRTITSYHNSLNTKWGTTPYGIINISQLHVMARTSYLYWWDDEDDDDDDNYF
jgi:hypothetical protein